jgi:hypothetical protein
LQQVPQHATPQAPPAPDSGPCCPGPRQRDVPGFAGRAEQEAGKVLQLKELQVEEIRKGSVDDVITRCGVSTLELFSLFADFVREEEEDGFQMEPDSLSKIYPNASLYVILPWFVLRGTPEHWNSFSRLWILG